MDRDRHRERRVYLGGAGSSQWPVRRARSSRVPWVLVALSLDLLDSPVPLGL